MKTNCTLSICKFSLMGVIALGTAGLSVGCDQTVSKKEETKTNSDGSTRTETEKTVKSSDGTMKTEKSMEKTPATMP